MKRLGMLMLAVVALLVGLGCRSPVGPRVPRVPERPDSLLVCDGVTVPCP